MEETDIKYQKLLDENKELKSQYTKYKTEYLNCLNLIENVNLNTKEIKVEKTRGKSTKEGTLIIPLFDLHVGSVIDFSTGIGNYNLQVFEESTLQVFDYLSNVLLPSLNKIEVTRIVLILGGDIIEGRITGREGIIGIETCSKQITAAHKYLLENIIIPLSKLKPVEIIAIPGNHGRLGQWGELHKTEDSLETIFYHMLENSLVKQKNITFHKHNNWYQLFTLYNKTYLVVHGDGLKSQPGAIDYKYEWQSLLDKKIDVVILGHHHNLLTIPEGKGKIICAGNWVGVNNYSMVNSWSSYPSQVFIISTPENPCEILYEYKFIREERIEVLEF